MYAIVTIAGKQLKVAPGTTLYTPTLQAAVGSQVTFDHVLLIEEGKEVQVGQPTVPGATVSATVLEHGKADKVVVFKKKRRKGTKTTQGHRQGYTKIAIASIQQV